MSDLEAALKTRLNAYFAANRVRVCATHPDERPTWEIYRRHETPAPLLEEYETSMALDVLNYDSVCYELSFWRQVVIFRCWFY